MRDYFKICKFLMEERKMKNKLVANICRGGVIL